DLRKNGAVVAGAGADMHDLSARLESELIIEMRPQARLAIVETAGRIDGDQDIVVEVVRAGIIGGPIFRGVHRAENPPRSRSHEMLARNCREGRHHIWRANTCREAQLVGKSVPRLFDTVIRSAFLPRAIAIPTMRHFVVSSVLCGPY